MKRDFDLGDIIALITGLLINLSYNNSFRLSRLTFLPEEFINNTEPLQVRQTLIVIKHFNENLQCQSFLI